MEPGELFLWATTRYVRDTRMDLDAFHLTDKRCSNVNYAVSAVMVHARAAIDKQTNEIRVG